ncbi:MAG: hypothetical protein U0869_06945 [Chloroflexota bacterium]
MVTVRDVEKVLSLRRVYNPAIIDTPTTVTDMTLSFFDACDSILLVVTSDYTSVRNTRMMNRAFELIGFSEDRLRPGAQLVGRAVGGLDEASYQSLLGRTPEFRVVSDGRLVVEANNRRAVRAGPRPRRPSAVTSRPPRRRSRCRPASPRAQDAGSAWATPDRSASSTPGSGG